MQLLPPRLMLPSISTAFVPDARNSLLPISPILVGGASLFWKPIWFHRAPPLAISPHQSQYQPQGRRSDLSVIRCNTSRRAAEHHGGGAGARLQRRPKCAPRSNPLRPGPPADSGAAFTLAAPALHQGSSQRRQAAENVHPELAVSNRMFRTR